MPPCAMQWCDYWNPSLKWSELLVTGKLCRKLRPKCYQT